MGNMLAAAAAKTSSGSSLYLIVILVLIFGVFYFLMIRPQRNRQRQIVDVQNSVVPGQRVRTTAGMYGTVTAVDDGDVVIEVAPGVEVRYMKRAIMDILSDAPDGQAAGPQYQNGAAEAASTEQATGPADEADVARGGHAAD